MGIQKVSIMGAVSEIAIRPLGYLSEPTFWFFEVPDTYKYGRQKFGRQKSIKP